MRLILAITAAGLGFVIVVHGWIGPKTIWFRQAAWNFTTPSEPAWSALRGQIRRAKEGLFIFPVGGAASLSSGPIAFDTSHYSKVRVSLRAQRPSEGRLHLMLRSPEGWKQVSFPFQIQGTSQRQSIVIPIMDKVPTGPTGEILLEPSLLPQIVVLESVVFESDRGFAARIIGDLWSPLPGEEIATAPFSINALPPPVILGRSVWALLAPAVLGAGAVDLLINNTWWYARWGIRYYLIRVLAGTWVLGLLLAGYHQGVALAFQLAQFGGRSDSERYAQVDGVPLWADMQEATRYVPRGKGLEFLANNTPGQQDGSYWGSRARYYLYPITLSAGSSWKLFYFGVPHQPCQQLAPNLITVHDAERFCIMKDASQDHS